MSPADPNNIPDIPHATLLVLLGDDYLKKALIELEMWSNDADVRVVQALRALNEGSAPGSARLAALGINTESDVATKVVRVLTLANKLLSEVGDANANSTEA